MGALISSAFIDPADLPGCYRDDETNAVSCPFDDPMWGWGLVQVLSIMAVYGYILFTASNMLSDGSELLLLVPSIAGIVGSVVLPILGAVPDGAIMLFSGMGDDAQEQLAVGVGTLAGSTIMLLTIPWGCSIFSGAVPLDSNGLAAYSRRREPVPKGTRLSSRGVSPDGTIRSNAKVMVLTAMLYLIIQGPAFQYAQDATDGVMEKVAKVEHWFSIVGLITAIAAFIGCKLTQFEPTPKAFKRYSAPRLICCRVVPQTSR